MSLPCVAGEVAGVSQCGSHFITARTLSRYTPCPPYSDDTNDECKHTAWTSEAELLERVLERNSSQGNVEGAASKPTGPCRAGFAQELALRTSIQSWPH